MRSIAFAAMLVTLSPDGSSTPAGSTDPSSYDAGFNAVWPKATHDACVKTATGHGGTAAVIEQYCTCVVSTLMPLPVAKKKELTAQSPLLLVATDACIAELRRH